MLLGALLLAGVAVYFMMDQPSVGKLRHENEMREMLNQIISMGGGKAGERIDHQTSEEKLDGRRTSAYWAAGLGFMLLGVGWAFSAVPRGEKELKKQ